MGIPELLMLVVLSPFAIGIYGCIRSLATPAWRYEAVGRNPVNWKWVVVLTWLVGLGWLFGLLFLVTANRQLRAVTGPPPAAAGAD